MAEKQPLLDEPVTTASRPAPRHTSSPFLTVLKYALVVYLGYSLNSLFGPHHRGRHGGHHHLSHHQGPPRFPRVVTPPVVFDPKDSVPSCPAQPKAIAAKVEWDPATVKGYREESAKRLSDLVRVPSVSYDDLDFELKDPRWKTFDDLLPLIEKTFPLIHKHAPPERVNTYGLLYTWKGRNPSLKPIVLMAHQDVVPVEAETIDQWTHPPFSGYFDGQNVWGRGSSDDKSMLLALLESVEQLMKGGWEPERTVILSFGFDEEVSGPRGAKYLAAHLLERYGKDSIEFIVDEGGMGIGEVHGFEVALPGVGEKGYTDVLLSVNVIGGHSSVPPDHTGIGILGKLLAELELYPHPTIISSANPWITSLMCAADHSPDLPKELKALLKDPKRWGQVGEILRTQGGIEQYLVQTSQAIDLIHGGAKVNALPESSSAVVNHRIAVEQSVTEVRRRVADVLKPVAEAAGLKLKLAFDDEFGPYDEEDAMDGTDANGTVVLNSFGSALEPAPVSPTDSPQWETLAATIRHLYPTKSGKKDRIVAPAIMTGNTDTRWYWDLTRHIYRFSPMMVNRSDGLGKIHTVDEHTDIDDHLRQTRFFHALIQNADALRA